MERKRAGRGQGSQATIRLLCTCLSLDFISTRVYRLYVCIHHTDAHTLTYTRPLFFVSLSFVQVCDRERGVPSRCVFVCVVIEKEDSFECIVELLVS